MTAPFRDMAVGRVFQPWVLAFAVLAIALALALAAWRLRPPRHDENFYDNDIWEAARRHRVSPFLVKAVIAQESSFDASAVGESREMGLMQITEGAVKDWERLTGRRCRLRGLLFDPRLNIEIGSWYLGKAMARWREYRDADVLALAQYNAGEQTVSERNWAPKDPREQVRLAAVDFPSTRQYIVRVRERWRQLEREYERREQQ